MTSVESIQKERAFLSEGEAIDKMLSVMATPKNNLVMSIGSSILAQGVLSTAAKFGYDAVGPMEWARVLCSQKFMYRNAAVSGQFTEEMLQRLLKDVLVYKPYVTVIQNGTNEIGNGYTSIWRNSKSMIDRSLEASQFVIVCSIQPRTSGAGWDLDDQETALAINEARRKYCENHPRLFYADLTKYITDPEDAEGRPLADMLRDGTHWTAKGAFRAGNVLADILNYIFAPADVLTPSYVAADGAELIYGPVSANPSLLGTAGTIGTGAAGTCPSSWRIERVSGTTAGTITGAKLTAAGIDPRNKYEFTFAPGATVGTEEFYIRTKTADTTLPDADDYYEALCGIEVDAWDYWDYIMLEVDDQGTGNKTIYDLSNGYDQDFPDLAWNGILRTPMFKSDGNVRLRLRVGIDGEGSGTGVMRIFNPQIRRVDPDFMPIINERYDNGSDNKEFGT